MRAPAPPARRPRPALVAAPEKRPVDAVEHWLSEYAPMAARVLLGLVLAWFGYHELVRPFLWTGYVPALAPTSTVAEALVLAHGWALLVLSAALVFGVAPRLAGSVAALLLFEIVVSLTVSHGLSDLVLRDVGVLGLSLAVAGHKGQRFTLRS
jgi:uncharacterized membrane protein YphA (DoxX/SURF4 family)